MEDTALLQEYAGTQSEPAFAALVERHVGLVYSAARRQVGDAQLAEDVTQAVFIILAQQAGRLARHPGLSGWLLKTTRHVASNQIRAAIRRTQREQESFMQSTLNEPADEAWEQLAPLLDEAMASLGDTDRAVLALRYFENKTAGEIAVALRMGEDAAQRRVTRALEKLRAIFLKRGVKLTAGVIAGSVAANSVHAAPAGLAAAVTAAANGAAVSTSTLTLVKGALKIMAWTKTKTAIVAGMAVILAAGTTTVMMHRSGGSSSSVFQLRLISTNAASRSDMMTVANVRSQSGHLETLDVQRKVLLDRSAIRSVHVVTNSFIGQPPAIVVDIRFTPAAARQFARITRENVGRRLAIVVEGKLISAPRIASGIPSGEAQISGNFTAQEANRLASLLNNPNNK